MLIGRPGHGSIHWISRKMTFYTNRECEDQVDRASEKTTDGTCYSDGFVVLGVS